MSLKWFHLLFITTSVVLAVGVALWAVQSAHWLLALVALASGAALIVYRGIFLQKASKIGLQ
jgi:uncharacterized membrane protein